MASATFSDPFAGAGTVALRARETNPEVESSNLSGPPYKLTMSSYVKLHFADKPNQSPNFLNKFSI